MNKSAAKAVLFDLGGTLVDYWRRAEWPEVFKKCAQAAAEYLGERGVSKVDPEEIAIRMDEIRAEESGKLRAERNWKVWPMEERMRRVFFGNDPAPSASLIDSLCREFVKPMTARARVVPDAVSTVRELKRRGLKMAVVSNMPWGSPREPWEEEIKRHGLAEFVPVQVTCRDAGWRKPDRRIFELACANVDVKPGDCLFVGDEPVWDYEGAAEAGLKPVLHDPAGEHAAKGLRSIKRLPELLDLV